MENLLTRLQTHTAVTSLLGKKGHFVVDETLGTALLVAAAFKKKPQNYVLITTNLYNAQQVYDLLSSFLGEQSCLFFPNDELLRAESIASNKEMLAQRLYVLNEVQNDEPHIVIANAAGALRYLPNPQDFKDHTLTFEVGQTYSLEEVKRTLIESGYSRVNKIDQSLQFALRGDILDIYSVNLSTPIRIEFFGDEVESIRYFEIATQTSAGQMNRVAILPASDMLLTEEEIRDLPHSVEAQLAKDVDFLSFGLADQLKRKTLADVERITQKNYLPNLYKYYGYAQKKHYSIIDYVKNATTILGNEPQLEATCTLLENEALDYFTELYQEGQLITHLSMYQSLNHIVKNASRLVNFNPLMDVGDAVTFAVRPIIGASTNIQGALTIIDSYLSQGVKVVLALSSDMQMKSMVELLKDKEYPYEFVQELDLPKGQLGVTVFNMQEGFELVDEQIVYLTSRELLGYRNRVSKYLSRFKESTILRSYEDLTPGDYVVHEYNGIGQFIDIKTLEVDGIHRDFLHIAYAGTDVLYVPLSQFQLVRKFIGKEGAVPKLNRLNSMEWEKTKKKIKDRVNDIADKLIQLYAERAKVQGYAFPEDDEFIEAFESQFPFELTEDQQQSINEIKKDMEKSQPMDRLLCGDVGFGKTEIAFRAAFKAIINGKQVALLCPTTLLARQHYEVAVERFQAFGVRIAILSRLVPESMQKAYIENIKAGRVDLIIGTHRLLSKEIKYHDLGLLIVDEEQRFGVEQKERIKEIKTNVDVLTLSATPIPRTLQISLLGIRQLSQINTPPTNRMPIQTYVIPYKEAVIKELIERELGREGQIFYLHNQVSTIFNVANKLQRMVKQAQIGVVHGQMDRDQIEDVMMRFYSNEINLLVCTSIVENGIDVPNANMIIVEDADKFGLAQLYQIKGRVGRGNRIAYAYLLYQDQKQMTEVAQKRLKAIQDFTELGSGYKIAQRDLMIRGAGDILGAEQAGFIDTVGIDMYLKLLNEAIIEKKTGVKTSEPPKATKSFNIDAYIPASYAEKADKIELYQELESAKSLDDVELIVSKIRDIYGRIPHEVDLLIRKRKTDLITAAKPFQDIVDATDYLDVKLADSFTRINGIGTELFTDLIPLMPNIKVNYASRELRIRLFKKGDWFANYETLIIKIVKLYDRKMKQLSI